LPMFGERLSRVRQAMKTAEVDAVLLSVGPDLPWLIGYEAMPLERLTMLVVPVDRMPTLVLPAFEVPRVSAQPDLFDIDGWGETDDPIARVAEALGGRGRLAIGEHTWSRFLISLQDALPTSDWVSAAGVVGGLRAVKDEAEVAALQRAADGVDRIADALRTGQIPLIGRTEAEVSADLGQRIIDEGHDRVNFAIVASGANAASPHHHPGSKVIAANEVVLCDFGGTTAEPEGQPGYCSDITRCVYTGTPPAEFQEAYDALQDAQALAVAASVVGASAGSVDSVARNRLAESRLDQFFLHRLGHGIGVEAHENPYLVDGNDEPLMSGNAFSIEPGFYMEGKWGARIEDIVVATEDGPLALNTVGHDLAVVEA
jgi:Xaa-Pro aminopeptidase